MFNTLRRLDMAIPQEILKLKPKNTRIKATSKPNEYNVIARTSKRVNGKIKPVELGVIGKIIDGVYYPNKKEKYEIDTKTYGHVKFVDNLCRDLFKDLIEVYPIEDAKKLYLIALLRATNPDIKNEEIEIEYKTTFASEFFSGVGLSSDTLSNFLDKIGKASTLSDKFMLNRIEKMMSKNVVVDGMLKSNNSITNNYSEFSRKGRIKGSKDVSILYAYSLDVEEPLAVGVYPGNMLDHTSFSDFIDNYSLTDSFIIVDKGFDVKTLKEKMIEKNLSYLCPIKKGRKEVKAIAKQKFNTSFVFEEDTIRGTHVEINGKHYYAYISSKEMANQARGYLDKNIRNDTFDADEFEEMNDFGMIIFESNNPSIDIYSAYKAYKERWDIENLFRKYKNIIDRSEVNAHGNYRLQATEFINFISCIMVMRMKKQLFKYHLEKKYSLPMVIRLLSKIIKKRSLRLDNTWLPCKSLKYIDELAKTLGV